MTTPDDGAAVVEFLQAVRGLRDTPANGSERTGELRVGVRDLQTATAVAELLTAAGVVAEPDIGFQGYPASVVTVVESARRRRRSMVLRLARLVDPGAVELPPRAATSPSLRVQAARVASESDR